MTLFSIQIWSYTSVPLTYLNPVTSIFNWIFLNLIIISWIWTKISVIINLDLQFNEIVNNTWLYTNGSWKYLLFSCFYRVQTALGNSREYTDIYNNYIIVVISLYMIDNVTFDDYFRFKVYQASTLLDYITQLTAKYLLGILKIRK